MLTQSEIDIARERGRQMACRRIMEDDDARRRVEEAYGIEYCRRRYPEAYQVRLEPLVYRYVLWQ